MQYGYIETDFYHNSCSDSLGLLDHKFFFKHAEWARFSFTSTCEVILSKRFPDNVVSFPENCINGNTSQLLKDIFHLLTSDLFRPQAVGNAARQSRCVVTSASQGRGILSLDKHVALSAAVNFLEWQLAQSGTPG